MDELPGNRNTGIRNNRWKGILRNGAYILAALLVFVFSLDLMLSSLQRLGQSTAEIIILATSNPFTALFIGLLITALIQSSTATTSMTVALVASGALTLESAVPIIMGANVGTTITSTIVSLGFIAKRKEFRRAVAAGTYHDFFNILTAIILFPLEYYFHFLSGISRFLATTFFNEPVSSSGKPFALLGNGFGPVIDSIIGLIDNGFVLVILSFVLLFGSILFFRKVITNLLGLGSPGPFHRLFFKNPLQSFGWGLVITGAIRSSSVTTSLVVPLVAKKVVKLRRAVPFILGANIGTTISAFLAAMLNSNIAISIAIAHLMFNLIGVTIFFPISALRQIPIELANGLGRLTLRYRLAGLLYILLTFFFIPFSLIYLNQDAVNVKELSYQRTENNQVRPIRVMIKTFKGQPLSSWMEFEDQKTEPSRIFSIYRRDKVLMINNQLFEVNAPGFCRDGEDGRGRYRLCVNEVIQQLSLRPGLTVDSVFVYEKKYVATAEPVTMFYISFPENLIVRKEERDSTGSLIYREELIARVQR